MSRQAVTILLLLLFLLWVGAWAWLGFSIMEGLEEVTG